MSTSETVAENAKSRKAKSAVDDLQTQIDELLEEFQTLEMN